MTDQQNAALEPCPFCGGEAKVRERGRLWYVFCECRVGPTAQGMTEERAWAAWNTRPAPAGAEAVREALTGCMAALKSARSWFETIAEAPEDEADGFVEEAKNVVDAAYFNADCALDALNDLPTPQPAPTAAEDGLREFVESIVNAMGPYPDLNGHPIISAAYAALRSKPEAPK